MNFFVRLHFLLCLTFFAGLVSAQGPEIRTTVDQPHQLERWFRHGRAIPGQQAAALRYRAHRQKLELRALHAAESRSAAMSASPHVTTATSWTPLGPAPLASDATGLGVQDYGLVAGRATAVAIDPADGTGNTVYAGGAYGGVWKSTNAGRSALILQVLLGLQKPTTSRLLRWEQSPFSHNWRVRTPPGA